MENRKNKPVPVRSVKKALDLLEILVFQDLDRAGVSLSQLARRMNLCPNTAYNLLKTLLVCGYVEQKEDARYVAGSKCLQIGRWNRLTSAPARRAIVSGLQELRNRLKEGVVMAILHAGRRVELAHVDCNQSVCVNRAVLENDQIYNTATGRILMAHASSAELRQILERHGLPRAQWNGLDSARALQRALAGLRKAGACVVKWPHELVACACPMLDAQGKLLGALGCYVPFFRCPKKKEQAIIQELRRAADTLAGQCGSF